jgi:hypothetical protein
MLGRRVHVRSVGKQTILTLRKVAFGYDYRPLLHEGSNTAD